MANIVKFPKERMIRGWSKDERERREGLQEDIRRKKIDIFAREYSNDMFLSMIEDFHDVGIEIPPEFHRDYAFVEDAVYALIYRVYGIEHPLHEQMDKIKHPFVPDHEDLDDFQDGNDPPDDGPEYA